MKKKIMLALCLLSVAGYTNNVYAEETTPIEPENNNIIDGETEETIYEKDIPADKKDQYYYVKDETKVDVAKDLTKQAAIELQMSIESNGFTKAILRSYIVKTGEEINHIEEKFESLEKAMEYIKALEDEGIEVSNVVFTNDTEVKSNSLNETYETLEEAQKALEEFKKEYNENIEEKEIVDNKTDEILEENEGTISYATFAEAKAALEAFLNAEENQSREFYFEGSVVGPKEDGTFTETEINEQFESEEEAMEYLSNLEKEGYEILDYEFTNDTQKQDGSLNETYETLEEAQKASEEFKKEYNENIEEEEIVDNETDEVLESNEGTTSYNTYEEALAALNAFLNAEENQSREFYFEGSVVGPKGNGTYTKTDINETFNTKAEAEAFLAQLEKDGYTILSSTFTNDTRTDSSSLNETYETLEEAQKASEEFKKEYNENIEEEEIVDNETDEVLESNEGTTSYNTYEEALAALNAFLNAEENQSREFYFEGSVVGPKGNGTYTKTDINETFNTKAEAEAFLNGLKEKGYTIINSTFTNDTRTDSKTIDQIYETYEEALAAVKEFKETYNAYYSWTLNEVEDETENVVEKEKKSKYFNTEEEAQSELDKLIESNHDYIITGSVDSDVSSHIEDYTYDETKFMSRLDAENEISRLKSLGYDTSDMDIELTSIIESTITTEDGIEIGFGEMDQKPFSYGHFDVKIPTSYTLVENDNSSTINGTLKVSSVTITNNGKTSTITMVGPSNDETGKYKEYTSRKRSGLNVTNKSYVKITGTVTYKIGLSSKTLPFEVEGYLSEAENECGGRGNMKGYDLLFSSIKIINGKVYVDTNIVNIYKVSGTLHKEVEDINYYFTTQKTNLGYDYKVNAYGERTVTLESGKLTGEKEIENKGYFVNTVKKDKTHTVNIKAEKTVTLESGKLTGEKKIENKGYFVNTVKKDKTHTVNIKARKTITLKKGRLTGKKKIENKGYFVNTVKKDKTHTVNVSAKKTISLESGVLTADTKKDILEELYAIDTIDKKFAFAPMGDGEEENPKTGDDGLIAITIGGFSMIGMLAGCYYLKKEEENKIVL